MRGYGSVGGVQSGGFDAPLFNFLFADVIYRSMSFRGSFVGLGGAGCGPLSISFLFSQTFPIPYSVAFTWPENRREKRLLPGSFFFLFLLPTPGRSPPYLGRKVSLEGTSPRSFPYCGRIHSPGPYEGAFTHLIEARPADPNFPSSFRPAFSTSASPLPPGQSLTFDDEALPSVLQLLHDSLSRRCGVSFQSGIKKTITFFPRNLFFFSFSPLSPPLDQSGALPITCPGSIGDRAPPLQALGNFRYCSPLVF